ncbi:hypothetical protein AYI70_g9125 [Smittium culicis]|uniref:Uncharacterized protein n=1 Tax=Smittium culicis TaxID=133412 RepID=A0A1R1XCS3_9FUNG|nr:hypothetical protein AYI70_g9125 [Smittium culicis]
MMTLKICLLILSILSCVLSSCTIESIEPSHSYKVRHHQGIPKCCDIKNSDNCSFPDVDFMHVATATPIFNETYFNEIVRQIDSSYTKKLTFKVSYPLTVKPGTCKAGVLTVTENLVDVYGQCCGIIPYFSCSQKSAYFKHTDPQGTYYIYEYPFINGIGKVADSVIVKFFNITADIQPLFKAPSKQLVNQHHNYAALKFK